VKALLKLSLVAVAVAGLAGAQAAPSPSALKDASAARALALANAWGLAKENVTSFITPQAVNFKFSDGRTVAVPMPQERMIVSVAPYVTSTHPCSTHYTSSCRGEMAKTTVSVTAKSLTTGKVLLKGNVTTGGNGFADLWLPRGQRISLTIEAQGKKASGEISTFDDSNTCVTTFQLK
jgi:hypothetical protein